METESPIQEDTVPGYNPNLIPPSQELAELHYRCNQIGHKLRNQLTMESNSNPVCPCCLQKEKKSYGFLISPSKIINWGDSIPLYFKMLYLIGSFFVLTLLFKLPMLYRSYQFYFSYCSKINKKVGISDFLFMRADKEFLQKRLANQTFIKIDLLFLEGLFFIVGFVYVIWMDYTQINLRRKFKEEDKAKASDFTVLVGGVNKDDSIEDIKAHIHKRIEEEGLQGVEITDSCKGTFSGNIYYTKKKAEKDSQRIQELRKIMTEEKDTIDSQEEKFFNNAIKRKEKHIERAQKEEARLEKAMLGMEGREKNQIAFVSFETIEMKERVLTINKKEKRKYCLCLVKEVDQERLRITEPPEPEMVNWHNIGFSKSERTRFVLFFSIIADTFPFIVALQLSFLQALKKGFGSQTHWPARLIKMAFIPCVVKILKTISMKIYSYSISRNKYLDMTQEKISLTSSKIKTSVLYFVAFYFSSILIGTVQPQGKEKELNQSKLDTIFQELFNLFVFDCIGSLAMSSGVFKYGFELLKILKIRYIRKKSQKKYGCKYDLIPQKELNEKFTPAEWSPEDTYSEQLKIMMAVSLLDKYYPLIGYFYIAFLLIKYQAEKFFFYRVYKQNFTSTRAINEKVTLYISMLYFFFLYKASLSSIEEWLIRVLNFDNDQLHIFILINLLFVLGQIYFSVFLPFNMRALLLKISEKRSKREVKKTDKQKFLNAVMEAVTESDKDKTRYSEVAPSFETDYRRKNPLLMMEAEKEWMKSALSVNYDNQLM